MKMLLLALILLGPGAAPQAPSAAAVSTTQGQRTGQIEGWLMFRRPLAESGKGMAFLLVEGRHVLRIESSGAHLRPGTRIIVLFVTGDDAIDDFAPLGVAFRFAQTTSMAAGDSVLEGNIGIDARCCRVTSITGSPIREQLLGEFRDDKVEAQIRMTHAGGTNVVTVADIVKFKEQP